MFRRSLKNVPFRGPKRNSVLVIFRRNIRNINGILVPFRFWVENGNSVIHNVQLSDWRWPREYMERIRDGIPVHFLHPMKPYRVPQGDEKDVRMKDQLIEKLQKARDRRYISPGRVVSLTAFFGVKKGEDDVRPVYDGSVSGLNDCI
jgi:hypothetical protein